MPHGGAGQDQPDLDRLPGGQTGSTRLIVGDRLCSPAPNDPAWLLITGAPRSGTSLLRALLVEHSRIGLLQEYGLTELVRRIDAIVARPVPVSEDWDSPGSPDDSRFDSVARFYRERPSREAVTRGGGDPGPEHFGALASGLFTAMFPGKDLAVLGDKMPIGAAFEDLSLLFSRLPRFRVVAVIRNPADVVRSSLVRREATRRGRDRWPIATVEQAVEQWVMGWRTLQTLVADHGAAVKVVKYEDLCNRPQEEVGLVAAWLGLTPEVVSLPISALPADLALHTAAEHKMLERLLGPVIQAWPTMDAGALMTTFAALTLPYCLGDTIHFAREEATPFCLAGFSFREEWGRWTDGPSAIVSIPHGAARGVLLVEIRTVQAFVPGDGPCDVVVRSGWGEPKWFQLGRDPARIAFVVAAEETSEPGTLRIEILIARPKRPDEMPADGRALGLLVETVRVTRLATVDQDP